MTKTLTYEQCLDEVARLKGWKDWSEMFQDQFIGSTVYDGSIITYAKEAALLYGKSKFNEGCEAELVHLGLEHMLNQPKPTFKP